MTMTKLEPLSLDWPERWRRWLDIGPESDHWMRVEEMRDGDTMIVRAELPGIDPDKDVSLTINDGVLCISAHREQHQEERSTNRYHSEFHYGEFTREFVLPEKVDRASITATYRDGILEVRVPIVGVKMTTPTTIPVTRG